MYLRDISLETEFGHKCQKIFNTETWAVSELFLSKLNKYKTGNIAKCNIIVSDFVKNNKYIHSPYINVTNINKVFDFDLYFSLSSKYEKKLMQLDVLYKGMVEIASYENWDIEPIKNAYLMCIEDKLENTFFINNKFKKSSNHKIKAEIWCYWDIDIFKSYLVLFDKNGKEIYKKKFIETEPHFGCYIYQSKLKWVNNKSIQIEWYKNKVIINIDDNINN
jgi:hypothetical protein